MKIIFFGNTKYSLIDAKALHEHFGLTAVVTISDRENLHKKTLIASPVKTFAIENTIPIIETNKLTPDIVEHIQKLHPDFLVIADYGLILPQAVLDIPTYAPLNVHHSLLPKYRGTAPAPAAILNGDTVTGVTIIKMNTKVDDGDILAQEKYTLEPDETTDSLLTRLNELGSKIVIDVIEHYETIKPKKQDEKNVTFTKKMEKQDGYIDPDNPPSADQLDRMIRAYNPWPGVWSRIRIKNQEVRIKLLPSMSLRANPQTGAAILNNVLVQVEGKKPQTIKDFLNGYPEAKEWLERLLGKQ